MRVSWSNGCVDVDCKNIGFVLLIEMYDLFCNTSRDYDLYLVLGYGENFMLVTSVGKGRVDWFRIERRNLVFVSKAVTSGYNGQVGGLVVWCSCRTRSGALCGGRQGGVLDGPVALCV